MIQKNNARMPISELPYSSGLMSQSFWFIEFKKLVQLVAKGETEEEIQWECLNNNLFGTAKEYRTKRVYRYLKNRAEMLEAPLIEMFMRDNVDLQKQINLIAILRGDRLFFEFLYEVYRERVNLGYKELEDADFNAFFREKGSQSALVDGWNEGTKKHLRSNYTSCMAEVGLLRMQKKVRLLQRPIVDEELVRHMEDAGEGAVMKAIMGAM